MDSNVSYKHILNIEDMPNEMLEKIFESLLQSGAGLSLLRCREVCKRWKETAEKGVLRNKHWPEKTWYKVCRDTVPRNTALELLNMGTSRFKGNDVDGRNILIESIDHCKSPNLSKLKIDKCKESINLIFEDGCPAGNHGNWKRLFFHCVALNAKDNSEWKNRNIKHESKNFRTDTYDPDPVTSIKISGQMIITAHSSGCLWFWTLSGNSLDYVPITLRLRIMQSGIKSLALVDAYRSGSYQIQDGEGHKLYTDHHAIAVLSECGKVYLCALAISKAIRIEDIAIGDIQNTDLPSPLRIKSIPALNTWTISCINIYGDVILAGTSLGGKVFVLRLDTGTEFKSKPSTAPSLLSLQMLSFTDLSPRLSSGILNCNLWHLPGSNAWDWQCITVVHRTGSVFKCFLPNQPEASSHSPTWKRFVKLEKQDFREYGEFLLDSAYFYDRKQAPFHLIEPLQNLTQNNNVQNIFIEGQTFVLLSGKPTRTIMIGELRYAILPEERTWEALDVKYGLMSNTRAIFESCSLYRDDVFILITSTTKQMLVSLDGFYYRAYSPLKFKTFCGHYISAIHYTSSVLLLGTSDGKVRAYSLHSNAGILDINLDKPTWIEEPGLWTFGKSVNHIHVGLIQEYNSNKYEIENSDDGKVAIVIAHEDNSMTVVKRSLKFMNTQQ